jgi:hypothetical protein
MFLTLVPGRKCLAVNSTLAYNTAVFVVQDLVFRFVLFLTYSLARKRTILTVERPRASNITLLQHIFKSL